MANTDLLVERNQVRLLIGDTSSSDYLLRDDDISFFLANRGTVYSAAVASCRAIAARFGRLVDKSVGPLSLSASQKYDHYVALASQLQDDMAIAGGAQVYVGGISRDDKLTVEQDDDRVSPAFGVARDEYPGKPNPSIFTDSTGT